MTKNDSVLISHILQEIADIKRYMMNVSYDEFMQNDEKQKAVIRSLEIIGEAVKNVDKQIKEQNPHIPWRKIAAFRDLVIHEYFRVDMNFVWYIATENITDLEKDIQGVKKYL